jgi:prevent-host-death family protein
MERVRSCTTRGDPAVEERLTSRINVSAVRRERRDLSGESGGRHHLECLPRILVIEMTSLADAKARLSELVAVVAGTWERVVITKNGRPVAVLMAVEDLEALVETLEILSDPEAMAAIRTSQQPDVDWTTGEAMAAIMAKRFGRGAA